MAIITLFSACSDDSISELDQCALCILFHAMRYTVVIWSTTGGELELAVYELHKFQYGELAEEQQSDTVLFVKLDQKGMG